MHNTLVLLFWWISVGVHNTPDSFHLGSETFVVFRFLLMLADDAASLVILVRFLAERFSSRWIVTHAVAIARRVEVYFG